jgi:AAA15 family ATPase/GTPase
MAGYIERITGIIPHTNKSVDIPLDGKSLIITGGNGSGKTSLLHGVFLLINNNLFNKDTDLIKIKEKLQTKKLELLSSDRLSVFYKSKIEEIREMELLIESIESELKVIILEGKQFASKCDKNQAVLRYFEDKRIADIREANIPQSLHEEHKEIEQSQIIRYDWNVGKKLEQHLLNMKVRHSLALTENNDQEIADKIGRWFTEFENNLKYLFEDNSIKLHLNFQNYKFSIYQEGKPPFTFQTLSSGYNAILDIYAELIMQTEYFSISPTELEGVVFIDEIDSHLHISLQRLILPFFIESFPKVQFIVTTHSPFVLMSTKDILVFDLGKEVPYSISKVKSQNEILNEYLGVPTAMPIWAERNLTDILGKYLNREPDKISLTALKDELINAGLEEYFPDSAAKILEAK